MTADGRSAGAGRRGRGRGAACRRAVRWRRAGGRGGRGGCSGGRSLRWLAVALLASGLAQRSLDGLDGVEPGIVAGEVTLLSDPDAALRRRPGRRALGAPSAGGPRRGRRRRRAAAAPGRGGGPRARHGATGRAGRSRGWSPATSPVSSRCSASTAWRPGDPPAGSPTGCGARSSAGPRPRRSRRVALHRPGHR